MDPTDYTFTLRTSTRFERTFRLADAKDLCDTWQWWGATSEPLADMKKRARQALSAITGYAEGTAEYVSLTKELGRAALIEVGIDTGGQEHWTWKLPWEFILNVIYDTSDPGTRPAIVLRSMEQSGPPADKEWLEEKHNLLVVRSNPGRIARVYPDAILNAEAEVMIGNLGRNVASPDISVAITSPDQLRHKIQQVRPAIVHFAVVDAHQANDLGLIDCQGIVEDAIVVGSSRDVSRVNAHELADMICPGTFLPVFVGCNFYNSGRLIAPCIVGRGAKAAIAFFGVANDNVAENFFADFYLCWRLSGWNLVEAFRLGFLNTLESSGDRFGSLVVLWSATSLLKDVAGQWRCISDDVPPDLRDDFERERSKEPTGAQDGVEVYWIEPCKEMNYSLLHNNRSIFEGFSLRKRAAVGRLKNVRVEVILHAGSEQARYEKSSDMRYSYWLLENEIRVPLTAALLRFSHSTVFTSLFVRVVYKDDDIYRNTFRIKLLPIDQWQDDDLNRRWLPSFVFPDDAAVRSILAAAQRYVTAISDQSDAGFGGYVGDTDNVDAQVRAIWWCLTNEMPLTYISPPPSTDTPLSQRVRTPSDVVQNRRGTCIDLALLMTACLEYIGLCPVVFLLFGHAFTGYFRTERAHDDFCAALQTYDDSEGSWMFGGPKTYERTLQLVSSGELLPIETLALNARQGLWDAVQQGGINLRNSAAFEFVVDIKTARKSGVTPLPIA